MKKIKLAIKRDGGELQGLGGFHYLVFPVKFQENGIDLVTGMYADLFEIQGMTIITVDEDVADRLLESSRLALVHQCEVAALVHLDEQVKKKDRHDELDKIATRACFNNSESKDKELEKQVADSLPEYHSEYCPLIKCATPNDCCQYKGCLKIGESK